MHDKKTQQNISFADIKLILDQLVEGHDPERLKKVHHDPNFGWETLEQLKKVVVRPDGEFGNSYVLIDMELVAQGRGAHTNLVRALRDPTGVDSNGRMPYSPPPGRHATDEEIQKIVDWLNAGALE